MNYVIASSKLWNPHVSEDLELKTGHNFRLIQSKNDLTIEALTRLSPDAIFFPHWSHLIPEAIYTRFKCVMFHMTDLPYGRGGSPLQNLIVAGHKETQISAFICDGGLDTGPILMKRPLQLEGSAQQIFERASVIIQEMIAEIIATRPSPVPQTGEASSFKRRKEEDGNLELAKDIYQAYDFIRMLDAEAYPNAFIKIKNFKFEFFSARFDGTEIKAEVRIYED